MFKTNVAAIERPIRIALGAGIAAYAFFGLRLPISRMRTPGPIASFQRLVEFRRPLRRIGTRLGAGDGERGANRRTLHSPAR